MAEYIYFVASLPYLAMDKDSPITYKRFMELAGEQLSKKDYLTLSKATFTHDKEKESNRIIKDWDDFNYTLNEYITQERAKKLSLDDPKYKIRCERNDEVEKMAHEIVSSSNPLDAEKAILKKYFDFLSNHKTDSLFSLDALIIYALLLQIKERAGSFSEEKGRETFEMLYTDIRKDISLRSNL